MSSCDRTIFLLIDGSQEKTINSPCGSLSIKSSSRFIPGYGVYQTFTMEKDVQLYFDSLKIEFKGKLVPYKITNGIGGSIDNKTISVSDNFNINIHTNQFLDGDSLLVRMKGFFICEGKSVYDDDIIIIINEPSTPL